MGSLLDNQNVAKRLKTEREKTNLSPRKFAMRAGVDQSQYSKIEKALLPLTENIMTKLVGEYGLDRDYIIHGMTVPHGTNKPTPAPEQESGSENLNVESDIPQAIRNLTESNRMMAEAMLVDARSREKDAISRELLSRSNETLSAKVTSIGHVAQEIPPAVESRLTKILAIIAQVGSGKKWKSPQEGAAELHRIVYGVEKNKRKTGTHDGSGR